jgi:hypothetical protein
VSEFFGVAPLDVFEKRIRVGRTELFASVARSRKKAGSAGYADRGVRSSNEKSLLLLGLVARDFTRRICSLGQSGGGRGTGIEPRGPE